MDVIRTVSPFDSGLTLAFWLVAGEQAIYARHASRVLAPHRLMELPEQIPGAEELSEFKKRPVPVVPMALRGLYGSFFSLRGEWQ